MKFDVGIIGATGAVGQNYILLLENHPYFKIKYLAASKNSAGKKYSEAVKNKWYMDRPIPENIKNITVEDANNVKEAAFSCNIIFSSYEGEKEEIKKKEMEYAMAYIAVISNNSAHRWTEDVPMIIPEINHYHIDLINIQRKNRGFNEGFVVTKPNCSVQSFLTPIYAITKLGEKYDPKRIIVVTEQALSGAGYPGVPSLAIMDNIIPYIQGEEEKTEKEPLKIFGHIKDNKINNANIDIRATCTRVPVTNGHMAIVNVEFNSEPNLEEIIKQWDNFEEKPQHVGLHSAPKRPIIYLKEEDRPQPRKDRDNENGMAVTVGRLKKYKNGISFVGLSHNTIRGAAGGAILTAELLINDGYIKERPY